MNLLSEDQKVKEPRRIYLGGSKEDKQRNGDSLSETAYNLDSILADPINQKIVQKLRKTNKNSLLDAIHDNNVTFEEAFLTACYVLTATNNRIHASFRDDIEETTRDSKTGEKRDYSEGVSDHVGTELLVAAREKEMYAGLTPDEIAGFVAGSMLDLFYRVESDEVTDTCGMGGDHGFDGVKTINASTLSGIVNAAIGVKIMKHGSYKNTSPIGSTDFIEKTGANVSFQSIQDYKDCMDNVRFVYTDAHESKTIHDLSHLLMGETINHVIGPMTTPVSRDTRLNRVLGVNHNVDPETIAKAYCILNDKGYQKIGNVCVVAGLSKDAEVKENSQLSRQAQKYTILDELTPYKSVLSLVRNGEFAGTYIVTPEDFGVSIDEKSILAKPDEEGCYCDNIAALDGSDEKRAEYLALNSALTYFTVNYLSENDAITDGRINGRYLKASYRKCLDAIKSGRAVKKLKEYVKRTKGVFQEGGVQYV